METRRKNPRARNLELTAVVLVDDQNATLTIENLSAGGAQLTGALSPRSGSIAKVIINDGKRTITLEGTILRVNEHPDGHRIAVQFHGVRHGEEDRIHSLVLRILERQRRQCADLILLVGIEAALREQLERDLASHARLARSAATPLEAVWQLDDASQSFVAVIVEFDLDRDTAHDMLAHLIVAHPAMRRVLLSNEDSQVLDRELSSWRAHQYLRKPWTRDELAHLLHRLEMGQ